MTEYACIEQYKRGRMLNSGSLGGPLSIGEEVLFYNYSDDPDDIGVHDPECPEMDWEIMACDVEEIE